MAADLRERARAISAVAAGLAPAERDTFLERSCADDAELRRAVESILEEDSRPTELLDVALPTGEARAAVGGDAEPALEAGRSLGKYRIVEKLGEGGMGQVFVAEDGELGRHVALKVLSGELALESQHLERFRREARALAALNHPNIVTIYSVERADGCHFLTMERVVGQPLDRVVPEDGLELDEFFRLAVPLAEAVAAAHAQGVTHRDLKPANVMLSDTGEVKVLDFGLAKLRQEQAGLGLAPPLATLTQTGMLMGTIPYMSPEQVEGKPADHRTDIFSLGIVLYEMATGRRPFQGDTSPGTMSAILKDSPAPVTRVRSRLPSRLAQIIDRCLQKDPEKRYQDADALARDLRQLGDAVVQHPNLLTSLGTLAALMPRTRRWRVVAGSLVVVVLALGGVALNFEALSERLAAPRANPEIESLAVLPLANVSGDEEQGYLADGTTAVLINELSKLGNLNVVSHGSVMRFKGTEQPPQEIAGELEVDAVVEGSILRSGDQVRITAQLVHAESGVSLWADSFERGMEDILILQGEVAQAIARQVSVTLTPQWQARLEGLGAVSPEAAEAYFKGLSANIWSKNELFEYAIAQEPEFSQAHAALANNLTTLGLVGWPHPPEVAYGQARESATRALEIDPELSEGHSAQGWVAFHFDWDWQAAEEAFRRALELDRRNADARRGLSLLLAATGRFEEAIAEARRNVEENPSRWLGLHVFEALFLARRFEEASEVLHTYFGGDDSFSHFQRSRLQSVTDEAEAAANSRLVHEVLDQTPEGATKALEAALRTDEAAGFWRRWIEINQMTPKELYYHVDVAKSHLQIGQLEEALTHLERGFELRRPNMVFLGVDPIWDPLRSDPRFQDLLVRMKLPQARQSGA